VKTHLFAECESKTSNMHRRMRPLFIRILLAGSILGGSAASGSATSLQEAVGLAISTNPQIGIVASDRKAIDEELSQAHSLFLPSIDFRGEAGPEHTDNVATRARNHDGTRDGDEDLFRRQAALTLTQLLFDGFGAQSEVDRQTWRVQSAALRVRETSEVIGLEVTEAFLDVQRNRANLQIAGENVRAHENLLKDIKDRSRAGAGTRGDAEQAVARLAAARAAEATIRGDLRDADANYRNAVGDPPGELDAAPNPTSLLATKVDESVQSAADSSPSIAVANADVETARAELEGTQSSFYPRVDLQLGAQEGRNIDGAEGNDRSLSALLIMRWNLYRGGADSARKREFSWRYSEAQERTTDTRRDVERDIRISWSAMLAAQERTEQFAAQAKANAAVVVAYRDQFDLGQRTLLDVLDAQNELFNSRTNTNTSNFVAMFGAYRILATEGRLLSSLGVDNRTEAAPLESD